MTPKQTRTIIHHFLRLFSAKAWIQIKGIGDIAGLGLEILRREIRYDTSHVWYLSESGLRHFDATVSTVYDANYFDGRADYSDIWTASKKVLAEFIFTRLMPETAEEFLEPLREHVGKDVRRRVFVIAMYGLDLKHSDELALGNDFRLVRPRASVVLDKGVADPEEILPKLMAQMPEGDLWLVGTTDGTCRVARREFFHQARLTAGLLAVCAAATYERGSQAFRIGAVASPEEGRMGATVYLEWAEGGSGLGFGRQWRQGQDYNLDSRVTKELMATPVFATIVRILRQRGGSDLENAVVRAVYWFADAHKDYMSVMRLVKFWSCIEAFFSEGEDITKSVSIGTAAVLTFGPFRFIPQDQYTNTRKRVAALYGLRSKAVHRGVHDHVSGKDLADLSQWAAWLILSMASMTDRYTGPKQILNRSRVLDAEVEPKP